MKIFSNNQKHNIQHQNIQKRDFFCVGLELSYMSLCAHVLTWQTNSCLLLPLLPTSAHTHIMPTLTHRAAYLYINMTDHSHPICCAGVNLIQGPRSTYE